MSQGLPKNISKIIDEKGNKLELKEEVERTHLDVYGMENKASVYNMAAGRLKGYIHQVPEELRYLTNYELRDLVKPDALLNQLRLKFWYEYDKAVLGGRKMSMTSICRGVCESQVFVRILKDTEKMAYILNPIVSYEIQVQDFLETALYKMRKAIDTMDVKDSKDLNMILKIYEAFDKRIHGDYTKNEKKEITMKSSDSEFKTSQDIKRYLRDNNLENEV